MKSILAIYTIFISVLLAQVDYSGFPGFDGYKNSAWEVTDLENLTCWLRSDMGYYLTVAGDSIETWADASGNGNDFNEDATTGNSPRSYAPDSIVWLGDDRWLEVLEANSDDFKAGASNFSYAFWIRLNTTGAHWVLGKRQAAANLIAFYHNSVTNNFYTDLGDVSNNQVITAYSYTEDTDFHCLVISVDRTSDEVKVYIDGEQIGSTTDISAITGNISPAADLGLGARIGSNYFDGYINEMVYCLSVISQPQAQKLYINMGERY